MKKRFEPFQQYLVHDLGTADVHSNPALADTLMYIGLVVWRFNTLERSLDHAICKATNDRTDAVGLIVIHGMPYSQKVELYRRMCEDLHEAVRNPVPSFDGLIDALKKAAINRNLVVHADWTTSDAKGYTFTKLQIKNGGMAQEYAQLTVESMESICDEMTATLGQFHGYLGDREDLISFRPPA